jgi:hypothetical protein
MGGWFTSASHAKKSRGGGTIDAETLILDNSSQLLTIL